MVMAARVKTLWELGRHVPAMMTAFGSLTHYLGSERESQMLDSLYEHMPDVNFSSHLVEKVPTASVVVELNDVVWSDWGNEKRITETLRRIGKTPLFAITSGSPDQAQHPSLTRPSARTPLLPDGH